ncbi:MAG: hypothetical protein D6693_10140 [Planctomycetota bacterium]|nr:MAG: hypothetical protein D6693_10140 [Planctomycetota bacterium]
MITAAAIAQAPPPGAWPIADAQFWIVTAAAALAAGLILWRVIGPRRVRRRRRAARAQLTIEGRKPDRRS